MLAGRELDALVAEKVMGLEIINRSWPCGHEPECGNYEAALDDEEQLSSWFDVRDAVYKVHQPLEEWKSSLGLWCDPIPHYSTDIAAAWLVVEKMRQPPYYLEFDLHWNFGTGMWTAFFNYLRQTTYQQIADTAPEAICIAALRAVGVKV